MPFTIPWFVSKMNRQKIPATIDATAHGISTAMKKIETPRNARLRTSAVTSARGSVTAVDAAAKNSVRGIAAMTSLSAGSRSRKLCSPMNGREVVLLELDPEEAEAEHGEGRREHDQPDQDQAGHGDEKREPPLTEAVEPARDAARATAERLPRLPPCQPCLHCDRAGLPAVAIIALSTIDCQHNLWFGLQFRSIGAARVRRPCHRVPPSRCARATANAPMARPTSSPTSLSLRQWIPP